MERARQIFGEIERKAHAIVRLHAAAAAEGDAFADRVNRAATRVYRMAELLGRISYAETRSMRLLAKELEALLALVDSDDELAAAELRRLRGELRAVLREEDDARERLAVESALRKKTG